MAHFVAGEDAPRDFNARVLSDDAENGCTASDFDVVRVGPQAEKPFDLPEAAEGYHRISRRVAELNRDPSIVAASLGFEPAKGQIKFEDDSSWGGVV
ncbi:hypothetical protein [Bradyrhizobium sp.]|uniref:hypothetical protein n=1 Tax=Bradyrhizobium sp. TaxID=376 RepID=UPI003C525B02